MINLSIFSIGKIPKNVLKPAETLIICKIENDQNLPYFFIL